VIDWGIVARAVHIVAVVVWIGGVWLVTTVLLPGMRQKPPQEWTREFEAVEHRFAPQARIAVLLVLLSGLYMLYTYNLWNRFSDSNYWWMHLMLGVWALFAALIFLIEPLARHRATDRHTSETSASNLNRVLWFHRAILLLSMVVIFAAVCGSHGLF
jgi:uncharacterized membrane protein